MSATPAEDLRAAFAATSDDELLTMFARLTHAIHEAERQGRSEQYGHQRPKRDLVQGEILRRMGASQ